MESAVIAFSLGNSKNYIMTIKSFFKALSGVCYEASLVIQDKWNDKGFVTVKLFGYNMMTEIELDSNDLEKIKTQIESLQKQLEDD